MQRDCLRNAADPPWRVLGEPIWFESMRKDCLPGVSLKAAMRVPEAICPSRLATQARVTYRKGNVTPREMRLGCSPRAVKHS